MKLIESMAQLPVLRMDLEVQEYAKILEETVATAAEDCVQFAFENDVSLHEQLAVVGSKGVMLYVFVAPRSIERPVEAAIDLMKARGIQRWPSLERLAGLAVGAEIQRLTREG